MTDYPSFIKWYCNERVMAFILMRKMQSRMNYSVVKLSNYLEGEEGRIADARHIRIEMQR